MNTFSGLDDRLTFVLEGEGWNGTEKERFFLHTVTNKFSILHNPMITFGDLWRGHDLFTEEILDSNMTLQTQGNYVTGFSFHRNFTMN